MKTNNQQSSFLFSLHPSGSLPSLSLLGGEVLNDFNNLHHGSKGAFNRLYKAVFNWLIPRSKLDPFYFVYLIPEILDHLSFPYALSTFYYFCRLFYYTGGGVHVIDSRTFKPGPIERRHISRLIKLGYVSRSSFLPSSPYLIKNRCIQKVFISLTTQGIAFYNKVLIELYKRAKSDLYQLTQDF